MKYSQRARSNSSDEVWTKRQKHHLSTVETSAVVDITNVQNSSINGEWRVRTTSGRRRIISCSELPQQSKFATLNKIFNRNSTETKVFMASTSSDVIDHGSQHYHTVTEGAENKNRRFSWLTSKPFSSTTQIRKTRSEPNKLGLAKKEKQKDKNTFKKKRLVFKNGETNIGNCSIKKRKTSYLVDIYTTMIDIKWRYAIILFVAAFVCSWLLGALVYWLIAFAREDTRKDVQDDSLCVLKVNGFISALLFSIETQHTIGYGYRAPADKCPEVVLFIMIQSCLGVIIQAMMTGYVFTKLNKPNKRAHTLIFSKTAVICKRDKELVLLIRVGDMRVHSALIEAQVRGLLIKKRITKEKEILPLEQYEVDFGRENGTERLFMPYPILIKHIINENSPFWNLSKAELRQDQFEFVVILTGIAEATGNNTQAKTSYLPTEIKWGHTFEKLITYQKDNGEYQINYEKFHSTKEIPGFSQKSAKECCESTGSDNDEDNHNGSDGSLDSGFRGKEQRSYSIDSYDFKIDSDIETTESISQ